GRLVGKGGKRLARSVEVVHGAVAGGKADNGADRLRLAGKRGGEMFGCGSGIVFGEEAVALLDERLGFTWPGRTGETFDESLDLALRQRADEPIHGLAVLKGDDR